MFREKMASRVMKVGMVSMIIVAMILSGISVIFPADLNADAQILGGEYGGNLRVALKAEPNTFNPLSTSMNEPASQVIDLLYDSLGRTNPYTYKMEPWVASGWTIDAADNSIITIDLRTDVKWHDGTMVTLDDVEYTFTQHGLGYIDSMTQNTTANSLTIDLDAPTSKFFSEALVLKLVKDGTVAADEENGCGPFYLDSSDADGTSIIAFEDYFKGRPYLDSISYTYYPDDLTLYGEPDEMDDEREEGIYRAGFDIIKTNIDFIGWDLTSNDTTLSIEIPYGSGNYTNLVQNATVSVQRSNGMSYWYLGMNCADNHTLNDPELRKGIAHALDKEALTVFDIGGGLEVSDSIVSKYNIPWYNDSINTYEYDVSKASAILNEAGYYDYNGDGWRDKPDKTSFDFTILGPAEDDLTPNVMAGIITGWLQGIGINVELISNTSDVHQIDIDADTFDMFLFTETRGDIDPQFLGDMFLSEGIATNDNLLNFMPTVESVNESLDSKIDNTTGICNLNYTNIFGTPVVYHNDTVLAASGYDIDMETGVFTLNSADVDLAFDYVNITYSSLTFDDIMKKANAEMDPDVRAMYIKEAQGLVSELMPEIPLFTFRVNHAYNSSGLIGWTHTLGGLNNFWSFTNLRNPLNEGNMDVSISIPLAVKDDGILGGEETSMQIKVEDIDGTPLSGVDLVFNGEGTFGTPTYDESTGGYTASYTAPETESTRTVTLTVNAAKVSEGSGSGTIDITVRSLTNEFTVEISKGESSIPSGNETTVSFIVLDKVTKAAVPEADITLSISPSGLGGYLNNYSGITDAAGEYTVAFGAENVTIDTTFRITAKVNKDSYTEAEKSTSINVVKMETEAPDRGFLGLPAPSMIVVLLAFAGLALMIRKRKY